MGQDALLIHDEAHLTPAFGALVRWIAGWQRDQQEPRPLQILELSATQRSAPDGDETFALNDDEKADPVVSVRRGAAKTLRFQTGGTAAS